MLLWFVKNYEHNLKKLQFTTQRFDIPVTEPNVTIQRSVGAVYVPSFQTMSLMVSFDWW